MNDHNTAEYWRARYHNVSTNLRNTQNKLAQSRRNERRLLQLLDVFEKNMSRAQNSLRNLRRLYHHRLKHFTESSSTKIHPVIKQKEHSNG